MGAIWIKLIEIFQRLAGNAAVRKFVADVGLLAIERIINWLEGVLRARKTGGQGLVTA